MISRSDIEQRVREWGLREEVVEKDYIIGWVLWGIGRDERLGSAWAFKGGTSLKKCYIETYRFSEDLDFTVLPGGPVSEAEVGPLVAGILERVSAESGIDFSQRVPMFKTHPSGHYTEGRVYYVGPRRFPTVSSIRIDLISSEHVARPCVRRQISHPYPDELPTPATILTYGFEEVFAEKIRAMGERGRPRDLYDIINLYRRRGLELDPASVREVLAEKCQTKGLEVPTIQTVLVQERRAELQAEWENMLAHQLPMLPPLEDFLLELPNLFSWLEGATVPQVLRTVAGVAVDEDPDWTPPPTAQTWGLSIPMETIRFAAANHLCVDLGYGGSRRLVEPYSLRRTRQGNLVLHAIRADDRQHRSYRVDRIQSASATQRSFVPQYLIEFSTTGAISASLARAPIARPRGGSARSSNEAPYTIQCPYCNKQFRRRSVTDTILNEHKAPGGYRCAGSGHRGYLV